MNSEVMESNSFNSTSVINFENKDAIIKEQDLGAIGIAISDESEVSVKTEVNWIKQEDITDAIINGKVEKYEEYSTDFPTSPIGTDILIGEPAGSTTQVPSNQVQSGVLLGTKRKQYSSNYTTDRLPISISYSNINPALASQYSINPNEPAYCKPVSCNLCSYKCMNELTIKRHMLGHTGERPFQCNFCPYACRDKTHLRKHITIHTGEKPVNCDLCPYKCRTRTELRRHILSHTGEKPVSCELCDYKCRQKGSLKQHMFNKH